MSLIDADTLKSFYGENSRALDETTDSFTLAVSQAENIVFQNTLIPIPKFVDDAIPQLQFYAHTIFAYFFSGGLGKLDEDTRLYRKSMYESTMKELNEIREGKRFIYDAEGNIVNKNTSQSTSGNTQFICINENRSERL